MLLCIRISSNFGAKSHRNLSKTNFKISDFSLDSDLVTGERENKLWTTQVSVGDSGSLRRH